MLAGRKIPGGVRHFLFMLNFVYQRFEASYTLPILNRPCQHLNLETRAIAVLAAAGGARPGRPP